MGLRSWRFPSRSSPNISEAVNKESYPLLHRNALAPWRLLRSRREDLDGEQRWRQTSPSLCSSTRPDEPQKVKVGLSSAAPRLIRTLSVPETSSTCPPPGFSSITITARRLSFSGELSNQQTLGGHQGLNPMTRPELLHHHHRASSSSGVRLRDNDDDDDDDDDGDDDTAVKKKISGEKIPEHRHSFTDSRTSRNEAHEAPPVSKRHIFRSCAHLDLLPGPSQSSSSILYLNKSFSISLGRPSPQTMQRSTLSLQLRGSFSSSSDWNLLDFTQNGKGEQLQCFEDTTSTSSSITSITSITFTTVNSRPTSSDSTPATDTLAPAPFRARSHSSSSSSSSSAAAAAVSGSVVRLNGKTNGVSGPQKSSSGRGSPDDSDNSRGNIRSSEDGRALRVRSDTVLKVQECPVSPHVLNCSCGCSRNQPGFLSLKEALELFRPDFISRSQRRIRKLEQKTRERRSLQSTDEMGTDSTNRKQNCTKPHPLSDNLFKPKDRVISGKEMQLRSRRIYNKLPEVTKKKEEEKRRMVLQTNRLRAEVFKKASASRLVEERGPPGLYDKKMALL
ncbi:uncharacterized protein LOC103042422 [Astyanax mexicanus]|uniref:uncharacterized protein LOC103042422 n=1 Tax=Astyanax mexicanus TaxID=7994 RepID=UPI0020CB57F3|nr:uncharacterized protein LOC103042422 [Astyanax mexicanus]